MRSHFLAVLIGVSVAIHMTALSAAAQDRAAAHPYAGTFKDDRVTLTLESDKTVAGDSYKGTIEHGARKYGVSCAARGDKLEGNFSDGGGNTFVFSAMLDGRTLTFTTGTTTYKLASQAAAANPLDQPGDPAGAPVKPDPQVRITEQPAAPKGQDVPLVEYSLEDPQLKCLAWSFVAPPDWTRQGAVVWTGHMAPSCYTVLRLANPKGSEVFELYPTIPFTTGDPQQAFGATRSQYLEPAECIRQIIIPWCRPEARQGKVLGTEDMPNLAKQEIRRIAALGMTGVDVKAARSLVQYTLNDREVLEMFYCITTAKDMPLGRIWSVDIAFSYRAEKDRFYGVMPLLNWMAVCLKENPEWTRARVARVVEMVNRRYPVIQATARNSGPSILDVSKSMARDNDRFISNIDKINTSRLNTGDAWTSAFRNTQTLIDPTTSEKIYNAPGGYARTFRTDLGTIYSTNDPLYDPWVNDHIRASELRQAK